MERRNLMLAALASAGGNASFTPVQVQKLFFLIDREASQFVGGPHFAFSPYDYGPFDRQVYSELERLEAAGLVATDHSMRYRLYRLTNSGYAEGAGLLLTIPEPARTFISQAANWVRSLSFQQLVAAIYNRYPEMKANSIFQQ
ncbi:hypothetical protein [Chelatococcus daeguensis]|jgi:hypothetical protein|uniref:hypothetical protein n=1 Tax=Chelatococcus daeguensis TaxID=444444 RepID=UPI0011AE7BEC|nr:hypothetical protein [Chelatococcus daeguensis]